MSYLLNDEHVPYMTLYSQRVKKSKTNHEIQPNLNLNNRERIINLPVSTELINTEELAEERIFISLKPFNLNKVIKN